MKQNVPSAWPYDLEFYEMLQLEAEGHTPQCASDQVWRGYQCRCKKDDKHGKEQ